MSASKKQAIYLIGYSGHAYVVIEAIDKKKYTVKGYFDFHELTQNPYKIPYLGNEHDDFFVSTVQNGYVFPSIGSNNTREKLIHTFNERDVAQINIISSSAIVSETALLGKSVFIAHGAIINAQTQIGNGSIINTGSIIEHECKMGTCVHIAPGVVLAGNVSVGNRTFIGANTVVKQGVKIGQDVIIGAGSVIIRDIPDGKKIVGNPGREI